MNLNNKIILSALTATMISLTGCSSDSSTPAAIVPDAWTVTQTTGTTSTCLDATTSTVSGICGVDTTLTLAGSPYTLAGNKVKVVNGSTLTIEAGVTVLGESTAYLVVTKGSKLVANGTLADPVIFTSVASLTTAPAAGQWGGVTILGNAKTNEAESIRYEVDEADVDFAYGGDGTHETDNSGTLTYVQILNSGFAVAPDKEVNGLSLCGVGSGTTIDNISVVDSGDDGIEIWGGNVALTNISIEGAMDDGFDVDSGYIGSVTGLTVTQTSAGAALIEMTNGGDAIRQRTDWTLDTFTLTASANQTKEGGIYFKDLDVTGTFSNGTIDMNASTAADSALHQKETAYASPVFTNVTVNDSNASRLTVTGDDTVLVNAFTGGTGNVRN